MTSEDLAELQYFASLLLSNEELDLVAELEPGTVAKATLSPTDPIGKAVQLGRLKRKCEINDSLLTTASRHSTPALQMAVEQLRKLDL